MKKHWRYVALGALVFAGFVYVNNTNLFAARPPGEPLLLAHRGIAQRFDLEGVDNDTCTAERILPPTNPYLENTIPSMRASFDAGADVVELDIHPTTDGQFAVFHDWTLDCRTDGQGVTREHTMAELRKLDIGYGYTADDGKTYPFRGKGIGMMPTLDEVLAEFPGRRLLINIKSNDPAEGEMLAAKLAELPREDRERLMVYGGDNPVSVVAAGVPDMRAMSRSTLLSCLVEYIGYGWSGAVPGACQDTVVYVPINVAPWLWGWPDRFLSRMEGAGSLVFAIGPYAGGSFSSGIDTPQDLAGLPAGYSGGIMTNEIETIAVALGRGPASQ